METSGNTGLLSSPTSPTRNISTPTTNASRRDALLLHRHHPPPNQPPKQHQPQQQTHKEQTHPQPSQLPITRPESNTYPTLTFVQADTSSFKQVVQMLTGTSETAKHASQPINPDLPPPQPISRNPIPPIKAPTKSKPPSSSRLYERRNTLTKNTLRIFRLLPRTCSNGGFSPPRNQEVLSPSMLDFPSLVLSPVTPLIPDPFQRSGWAVVDKAAEEKAIAEKGFYLHPSPVFTPRDLHQPRLLPLFPTTPPGVAGSQHP